MIPKFTQEQMDYLRCNLQEFKIEMEREKSYASEEYTKKIDQRFVGAQMFYNILKADQELRDYIDPRVGH